MYSTICTGPQGPEGWCDGHIQYVLVPRALKGGVMDISSMYSTICTGPQGPEGWCDGHIQYVQYYLYWSPGP